MQVGYNEMILLKGRHSKAFNACFTGLQSRYVRFFVLHAGLVQLPLYSDKRTTTNHYM